jgi:hypothetical protein
MTRRQTAAHKAVTERTHEVPFRTLRQGRDSALSISACGETRRGRARIAYGRHIG